MDQELCVGSSTGKDGCDAASGEGMGAQVVGAKLMPWGGGVLYISSSEPGLVVGEGGLVMLRDRDLTRLMSAWQVRGFGKRLLEGEPAREELL